MREVIFENRFKKALKLQIKCGKDEEKLYTALRLLAANGTLPAKYQPHKLVGKYVGTWECHLEPDWLLVYRIDAKVLILEDTGTHSDLF